MCCAAALSMAAGESSRCGASARPINARSPWRKQELRDDPEAEADELALIYRAEALDAEEAERVATTIMKDRAAALDTMAREELGLDPDELGSPWSAALSSRLGAFAAGAVVVVLPYMFSSGWAALIAAIVLASLALFAVGR